MSCSFSINVVKLAGHLVVKFAFYDSLIILVVLLKSTYAFKYMSTIQMSV